MMTGRFGVKSPIPFVGENVERVNGTTTVFWKVWDSVVGALQLEQ